MKVLVTGADGYLGTGVVEELVRKNHFVISAGLNAEDMNKATVIKKSNIFDIENPFEYFEKPDVLIHLAWRDGFKHASENHIIDLPKHYEFIKKMVESGLKHVCALGSMHEIGFHEGSITETTETNPLSLYGISKDALRRSVELLQKDNDFIFQWVRGYYIVGNSEKGCSIFSKITQSEKDGKLKFPFTLGQNQFDFIDYEEMCRQIVAVATQNRINGIINCCTGRPEKLADRVERFIKDNNYKIKLEYGVFPDRPYDSKAVWGDNTKIQDIMKLYDSEN